MQLLSFGVTERTPAQDDCGRNRRRSKRPSGLLRAATAAALLSATFGIGSIAAPQSAAAASLYQEPKYAAIVVNADTGEVLYAREAESKRYPASITKVMTLYLAFEAIEAGDLKLDDWVTISSHAAAQPPSKLGLKPGERLTVDQAIRVMATKSANDIATALAEKLGGTERKFAEMMTEKARELGMNQTVFRNASGLPDPGHYTTARDLAVLSKSVIETFPDYYAYFQQTEYRYRGTVLTNHNKLLRRMPGVDGIKTGFTRAAGFTLAASAVRGSDRLIAVVLGGPTPTARDNNVENLLDAGFEVLAQRERGLRTTVAANLNEPLDSSIHMIASIEQGSSDAPRTVPDSHGRSPTLSAK